MNRLAHHDDKLALWIAIIIILFSLLINLGIRNVVGDVVRGPGNFPTEPPLTLTLADLEEGVILGRGITAIQLPEELVGKRYEEVFKGMQTAVRFVHDNHEKTFTEGQRIWIPQNKKYKHEIKKYQWDHYYTETIQTTSIKIKMLQQKVWVYNLPEN
ncbi:MAG: hypothetical protein Q7R96_06655 [Nanoarchaeota archaeon]|nr:hypothetical protein [Nanoarchaeota archaeon]